MNKAQKKVLEKYHGVEPPIITHTGKKYRYIDFSAIPKWDIAEPVAISAAVVGAFIDKNQNPNQPTTPKEITKAFMDCIEAGCNGIHVHVRDHKGEPTVNTRYYHEVLDPVRKKYGRQVVIDGGCMGGKTFEESMGAVNEGLFDMAIVNPTTGLVGDAIRAMPPRTIQAQAEYFMASGVKPLIDVHEVSSIDNAKRYLIDSGLLKKPYAWHLLPGLPGTLYMPNPKAMAQALIYLVDRIREIDVGSFIMVSDSGRCTIYMTVLALLLGLHVRIGMEDTPYRYPHKDEKIESNAEVVKTVIEIAERLGRRPATADEYRAMAGIG